MGSVTCTDATVVFCPAATCLITFKKSSVLATTIMPTTPLRWSKVQCLTGSVVALVTPMKDDAEKTIDLEVGSWVISRLDVVDTILSGIEKPRLLAN